MSLYWEYLLPVLKDYGIIFSKLCFDHCLYLQDVTYEMDRGVNTNDQLLPCRGYQPHGRFPDLRQPDRSSLLCAKIGPLAKMFGIEEELTEMTTVRVEKSIR